MANFINGSRLKKYNEPLTQMLDRMHSAKTRKDQAEQLKLQAFKEAQERALRTKARKLQTRIMPIAMTEQLDEDIFVELFYIAINLLTERNELNTHAFIDSRADVNVISWETWDALGRSGLQQPTRREFLSFSKPQIACLGSICLKTRIQDVCQCTQFFM